MNKISKTAIVEDGAIIGRNVEIGEFSIIKSGAIIGDNTHIGERCSISSEVKIGKNNKIISDTIIRGQTTIGDNNTFLSGAKIGFWPKWTIYKNYEGQIEIGNNNFFGENFVINLSAKKEKITKIADRCYILNNVTIHHDCEIGFGNIKNLDNAEFDTIICSNVCCNGTVKIYKGADISSGVCIHHERNVGSGAKIAMGTAVIHDVLPFAMYIKQKTYTSHFNDLPNYFTEQRDFITNIHNTMLDKMSLENKIKALEEIISNESDCNKKEILDLFFDFVNQKKDKLKLNNS